MSPETLYCAECGRPSSSDELARFGDLMICPACKNNYAQKLREGVAPVSGVRYGGFWIRVGAYLIDIIILLVVEYVVDLALRGTVIPAYTQPQAGDLGAVVAMLPALGISALVNLAVGALYEGLFLSRLGATPGKMVCGLKVVRPNGSMIGFGRAVGRYLMKYLQGVIVIIGWIGFAMAGFTSEKRALHDMVCDTRVIYAR
jgi:uncharacterized RDD family membrane protein YckC